METKQQISPIIDWRQQLRKNKQIRENTFKIYDTPNAQTDILLPNTVYVSIFPQMRFKKPVEEDAKITNGLRLQPTVLSIEQLKEQVAIKGKTFCGCLFLDLDYYNKVYGKCTAQERLLENTIAWQVIYHRAIQTPTTEIQNIISNWKYTLGTNATNQVTNKEQHFILMSTFGLDVDKKQSKNGEDITPEYGKMYLEVRQKIIDLDLNVLFAYKTFSDGIKGERFRLIFKTNLPIFDWKIAHAILLLLQEMFWEYFDTNCTNVNRQFHGSNTPILETNPLFGTCIPIDKFFRIFEKYLKGKDSTNFARNMAYFSKCTGINLLNGAFHVRKVHLSDYQIQQLRQEQINTYNKDIFPEYHFCVKGSTCQKIFGNNKIYENTESLYYYIIRIP